MIIEYLKTGRKKRMNPKVARILEKKGFVRILDDVAMNPEPFALQIQKQEPQTDMDNPGAQPNEVPEDQFDAMDRDALIAYAEENELRIDRRWGDEKLRAELREQNQ